jgi:tetratricopeptide (TPR) repeat protein
MVRVMLLTVGLLCCETEPSAQSEKNAHGAKRMGELLFRERDWEGALDAFTESLELDSRQADVLVRRGDAYFALRKVNRAIGDYNAALQLQEDHVEALIRRAAAWRDLKINHKARDDFQTALAICPDDPGALEARASFLYDQGEYDGALRDAKMLVLLGSDGPRANKAVGSIYFARGEYSSAIQAYDSALQVSPDDAGAWYWSAEALLALGRDDEGASRIQELLRTNPEQAGGYARRSATYREPTADDLTHGRRQVEQLLKDRPEMARFVTPDDEIYQWAVRKFAGEDVPGRILWDRELPDQGWADHRTPTAAKPGRVRLRSALPLSSWLMAKRSFDFDELWSMLAFELHNLQSYQRFREVAESACEGNLTREGFVLEYTRLEFHALQRTRAWYLDCFRPWAKHEGVPTDGKNWRIDMPLTFKEFMEQYQDKSRYPWQPYLHYYDRLQKWKPAPAESDGTAE